MAVPIQPAREWSTFISLSVACHGFTFSKVGAYDEGNNVVREVHVNRKNVVSPHPSTHL